MVVIKNTKLKDIKTKSVASIVDALKFTDKKVLFVTGELDKEFVRCAANIPGVSVVTSSQLSVLDIVNNRYLVASVDAIRAIEENYGEAK